MLRRTISLVLIASALRGVLGVAPAHSQPSEGQSPRTPTRVPVTVALVDRLPAPDAPFVILRRPDATPADVILLPRDADASVLTDAVRALLLARRNTGGDVAATPAVLRARFRSSGGGGRPLLPWAPRVLNDLRRAPISELVGVGPVRSVQIWLPAQRGRN
jgi:hypothetical protein